MKNRPQRPPVRLTERGRDVLAFTGCLIMLLAVVLIGLAGNGALW